MSKRHEQLRPICAQGAPRGHGHRVGDRGGGAALVGHADLGELLAGFDRVLVPELNTGQLATLLRDKLLLDVVQLNKVSGQPLTVSEVKAQILALAPPVSGLRNIREATNE